MSKKRNIKEILGDTISGDLNFLLKFWLERSAVELGAAARERQLAA